MRRWIVSVAAMALVAGCDQPAPKAAAKPVAPKPAAPKPATWTMIRKLRGTAYFVTQPVTVGEFKRVWLGSIEDEADANGTKASHTLFEIDCKQNRVRFLQEESFDRKGDALSIQPSDSAAVWYYPSPDIVAYAVVEMGCGRKAIVGKGYEKLRDAEASDAKPGKGA